MDAAIQLLNKIYEGKIKNTSSVALTTITVLHKNNEYNGFYANKKIDFKFASQAINTLKS